MKRRKLTILLPNLRSFRRHLMFAIYEYSIDFSLCLDSVNYHIFLISSQQKAIICRKCDHDSVQSEWVRMKNERFVEKESKNHRFRRKTLCAQGNVTPIVFQPHKCKLKCINYENLFFFYIATALITRSFVVDLRTRVQITLNYCCLFLFWLKGKAEKKSSSNVLNVSKEEKHNANSEI